MFGTKWGRRETFIFPPHQPVYTIGLVFCFLFVTLVVLVNGVGMGLSPLAKVYLPLYLKTGFIGSMVPNKEIEARLICMSGGHPSLALPGDVVGGSTVQDDGTTLGLDLAQSARKRGFLAVGRGPEGRFIVGPLHTYLRYAVYKERGIRALYEPPMLACLILFMLILPIAIFFDIKRTKRMKYGRLLKGPIMCDPRKFNKATHGGGIGFTTDSGDVIRIPKRAEAHHFLIMADTGAGKTALMFHMLLQIQERDEAAIIYDPACEFTERFYNPERGDIILNPLDARCPYWGPAEELRRRAEARTLAASLFQSTQDKKGEFFVESPQKIFAHLLTFGPTPAELANWMANPAEIDKRVKGTEYALLIDPKAPQQRTGVLSSLGLVAESLRMLPKKEESKRHWSATEWAKTRKGWIFITSDAPVREALRPLHSLWIDWLILRLLGKPAKGQRPVWFIIDELASLQKLPQLHTALTENRKSRNPIVLGFQGKAQLEDIYGRLASVMVSQPATKIFLKIEEEKEALWVSKTLGDTEIERVKLAHHDGGNKGKNYTVDRQIDPAVMYSEIQGLADLHAYLKYANHIVRFSFPYPEVPITQEGIIPRPVPENELNFDPTKQPGDGGAKAPVPVVQELVKERSAGSVELPPRAERTVSVIHMVKGGSGSTTSPQTEPESTPHQRVLIPEESSEPDPDLEAEEATPSRPLTAIPSIPLIQI
jgi:hypothetical protein